MSIARRSRRTEVNIWPAFVDALGQLVIAIIFLLLIFTVAQFLTTDALSGRDQALQRLTQQINELTELLNLEKRGNEDLRLNVAQLSSELQSSSAAKDALTTRVAELAARAQDETARADRLNAQLADANRIVAADKEKVELQLRELESLRRDIEALRKVRTDLETQVAGLAAAQQKSQADLTAARDRSKELEAKLASEQERTALAQKEIDKRDIRLAELAAQGQQAAEALVGQQKLTKEAQDRVDLLNQQIAALREQLQRVSAALELSEGKSKDQQVQIADLGRRLNLALASKVEELARFRSEFFGRLREVLGAADPERSQLGAADRRAHRPAADHDAAIPVQLGAVDGARHIGGQVPGRSGRPGRAACSGGLRRVSAARPARRRGRLSPQPAHRDQADRSVRGCVAWGIWL